MYDESGNQKDVWSVLINLNSSTVYQLKCYERLNGYLRGNSSVFGTFLAYNSKTKSFFTGGGCTGFRIKKIGNYIYYNYDYTSYLTSGFYPLPSWSTDALENETLYKSSFFITGSRLALGFQTAELAPTNGLFGRYLDENVKIQQYPNQNPDDDDDDSGQSPADDPTLGDGDTSSDPIPDPPAQPIFDINNTGFVTIYNPTVTQIRELAYFMWSGDFTDLIKKMFAAPFDALISLKMLFVDVPAGTSQVIWLGNVETGVSAPKVAKQFIDVDMGSITISEFFGSFADYAPFTKIQIFLPFIGYKDLNVDEVMNSNLHLRYRVDVYSGACIAFLTVTKTIKSTQLNSILYQFDGNCAMELPFTQNDNSRYVAAILNSAASSALSLAASSTFTPPTVAQGFAKGESAKLELGSLAPVANGMLDILSTKPNVQRAGSLAGAVAAMGVKQPYIIIHRPIAQMPSNYQHYLGIPLNLTRQLSAVTGYTIVSQIFISSAIATDDEIAMITEILKSGVIL